MTTRLDTRNLLLIVGVAALLAACSGATSPAATSAPIGAPLARAGAALAPVATTTDAPGVQFIAE